MKVTTEQVKPTVTIVLPWDEAQALRQCLGRVEVGPQDLRLGSHLERVLGEYDEGWSPSSVGCHDNIR